ncbi:MAG: tetratricopeptide repeat protein [Formosimonas sp.]
MSSRHKPLCTAICLAAFTLFNNAWAQSTTYNLPKNHLTGETMYFNLIADMASLRNQPDIAYQSYMRLAQKTRDPRYAELAYKVALADQKTQSALDATALLKQLAPNATLGQDLVLQVKIKAAYTLADRQHYRPAYEAARELLAQDPKNTAALSLLTGVADVLGYDQEALHAAREWLKLEPNNPEAMNSLGYFLANKNQQLDEAERLIRKANELKPNTPNLIDSLGWVTYRQGRLDEALTALKQAATMEPHDEILTHLGEVQWQKGEREAALKTFQAAFHTQMLSQTLRDTLERLGIPLTAVNVKKGK